jgi:hypothetical protein
MIMLQWTEYTADRTNDAYFKILSLCLPERAKKSENELQDGHAQVDNLPKINQSYATVMSIQHRLYTTSILTEIHFYGDVFRIFIDPSSGHISLRRLRYCNVITCRQFLRYYKNVKIVINKKSLNSHPLKHRVF